MEFCAGFDHPGLVEVAQKQYNKFAGYHSLLGDYLKKTLELSEKLIEVSLLLMVVFFYVILVRSK